MTTTDTSDSSALIRDWRALGTLILVLANGAAGGWLLARAAADGIDTPPPLWAFILILIAVLGLLMARDTDAVTETEREAGPAVSPPQDPSPAGAEPGTSFSPFRFDQPPARRRLLLFGAALVLIAFVLIRIPQLGRLDDYTLVALAWFAAIVCYAGSVALPEEGIPGRGALRRWRARLHYVWTERRTPLLLFLNIVLLALLLRAAFLGAIPHTLGGDEGSQGLEAVRVIEGEIRNPFTTGWLGVPTLSFYFNSLFIRLLGMTKAGLRLPWALIGTATVAVTFFLVRRLKGTTLALATAALLAVYHYHIHFSRLGSNQVADPLFVVLSLWFLYRALDRERMADWVLAGGTAGVALYFYAGARFTPVVIGAVLAYVFVREPRRFWHTHVPGVVAMVGAFLLVGAPMIQYALRFSADFNARLNQVGIIQSGWLAREVAAGRELLPVLWDQFRRAALAFNYYPDRTVWYGLRQPLLDPVFGAVFLLGLGYATLVMWTKSERRLAPLVAWWWGGMLTGGMLTESPPSSQRLITLSVPVCFFIAFALWQMILLLRQALHGVPARALLAVGVVAFAVVSLKTYFLDFTPQRIYGGPHAELGTDLAPILNDLDDTHDAYFVGAPFMYWGFGTIPYLAPHMQGTDILEPMTAPPSPDLLRPGRGAIFIILPPRRDELAYVRQAFPGGRVQQLHAGTPGGRLMATLYIVPPSRNQ